VNNRRLMTEASKKIGLDFMEQMDDNYRQILYSKTPSWLRVSRFANHSASGGHYD